MQLMQRGTDLSQIIYAPAKWLKNLTAPRHHTHLVVVQVTQKTAENDNTIGNITKEKAPNTQQQIDEILDKISVVGYEKLTQAEKEKLFQLSNKP
jgi:predicted transposase YdaD